MQQLSAPGNQLRGLTVLDSKNDMKKTQSIEIQLSCILVLPKSEGELIFEKANSVFSVSEICK